MRTWRCGVHISNLPACDGNYARVHNMVHICIIYKIQHFISDFDEEFYKFYSFYIVENSHSLKLEGLRVYYINLLQKHLLPSTGRVAFIMVVDLREMLAHVILLSILGTYSIEWVLMTRFKLMEKRSGTAATYVMDM